MRRVMNIEQSLWEPIVSVDSAKRGEYIIPFLCKHLSIYVDLLNLKKDIVKNLIVEKEQKTNVVYQTICVHVTKKFFSYILLQIQ